MNLEGKKTLKNIEAAFAGESQARNKYTFYAIIAEDEGLEDIADLFNKMAENEKEHGKIWYKYLINGMKNTKSNLLDAAKSENYEWKTLYPKYAQEAREEGLEEIALMFERIISIELDHERKFAEALLKLSAKENKPYQFDDVILEVTAVEVYTCIFCGNIENAKIISCSVCGANDSYC